MKYLRRAVGRRSVAAAAVAWCVLPGTPSVRDAQAQTTVRDHRVRYSIIGSLVGSALAGGYYLASDGGKRGGQCDPKGCALPYMAITGAISGLFLARELDAQRRAEMPRTGVRERFSLATATMPAMPTAMAVNDSVVVVLSDSGASVFAVAPRPLALRRRASALSGLRDVAVTPGSDRLLIAGQNALYSVPTDSGPASRLLNGAIAAVAIGRDGWGAAHERTLVIESRRNGATVRDSLDVGESVRSVTFDAAADRWLVGADSALLGVSMRDNRWQVTGRWPTAGSVRAIAVSANWIATAEGESGVTAWRRESLSSGVVTSLSLRGEPRFAYDLAIQGDELFVAGGTDGLFRVALGVDAVVRSVSRDLAFVTLVRSDARGGLWAGDRALPALVRVQTTVPPR